MSIKDEARKKANAKMNYCMNPKQWTVWYNYYLKKLKK